MDRKQYFQEYRKKNREQYNENSRRWTRNNRDKKNENNRLYRYSVSINNINKIDIDLFN